MSNKIVLEGAIRRCLESWSEKLKEPPGELRNLLEGKPLPWRFTHRQNAPPGWWQERAAWYAFLEERCWLRHSEGLSALREALADQPSSHWLAYWRTMLPPRCPHCGQRIPLEDCDAG